MKTIQDLFQGKTFEITKSKRTERGDLITMFTQKVNETRAKDLRPITVSTMGYMLSVYNLDSLYYLWRECEKARSFSGFFWYFVNPKNKLLKNGNKK